MFQRSLGLINPQEDDALWALDTISITRAILAPPNEYKPAKP
jgi:hypothetical protein